MHGKHGEVKVLRLGAAQDICVSVCDPTISGNSLVGETQLVNYNPTEKNFTDLVDERALVLTRGKIDGVGKAAHVSISGDVMVCPRAEVGSAVDGVGSSVLDKKVGDGPLNSKPKFLRTKWGDLPLCAGEGGANNIAKDTEELGLVEVCSEGPVNVFSAEPLGCGRGSLPLDIILPPTVKSKGGRIKKTMKKPLPYHPYFIGCKQFLARNLSKGGLAAKRKHGVGEVQRNSNLRSCSMESDPLVSSEAEASSNSSNQVHDVAGISLEVVLPCPAAVVGPSCAELGPASVCRGGGMEVSGVAEIIGPQVNGLIGDSVSDWLVDKETGDAHHIIDIQEDLGVTFGGELEDKVARCLKMEQRDRFMKNDLGQSNGYQ
jgi:hypothetical protein